MALVNIESALKQAVSRLAKMNPPEGLEVLSYKRNRSIYLMRRGKESILIRVQGYVEQELVVKMGELQKKLKSIFKTEFPRSRKVRIYNIVNPELHKGERKKL
jgi:hypothetical protein